MGTSGLLIPQHPPPTTTVEPTIYCFRSTITTTTTERHSRATTKRHSRATTITKRHSRATTNTSASTSTKIISLLSFLNTAKSSFSLLLDFGLKLQNHASSPKNRNYFLGVHFLRSSRDSDYKFKTVISSPPRWCAWGAGR
jgi:hypothetical protein